MKEKIDADRGFLEQMEELAMIDDDAMKWLIDEVYEKPRRLELFSASLYPNLEEIIVTIPAEILDEVQNRMVVLAGFGAGPAFAGQRTERFEPPVDWLTGIAWIDRWKTTAKRARLEFDDGSRVCFHGASFEFYLGAR